MGYAKTVVCRNLKVGMGRVKKAIVFESLSVGMGLVDEVHCVAGIATKIGMAGEHMSLHLLSPSATTIPPFQYDFPTIPPFTSGATTQPPPQLHETMQQVTDRLI
jgi:hypothetical protein